MSNVQKIDAISIIIMSLIGIVFFSLATQAFQNLDADCPSSMIRNGFALIQALGACMAVVGCCYFICLRATKGGCYKGVDNIRTGEVSIAIFGFFFFVLLGICAGILKEYSKLSDTELLGCENKVLDNKTGKYYISDNRTTKKMAIGITIICGLGFIFCIGFFIKLRLEELKEVEQI